MADGKTVQLGLFDERPNLYAQLAGLNPAVKAAMNRAADRCRRLSRQQICDAMNDLADAAGVKLTGGNAKQLSFATLEKWLNPQETEHLPSLPAIHVFCLVVNDLEPLRVQADVITGPDRLKLAWAEAEIAKRRTSQEARKLAAEIGL